MFASSSAITVAWFVITSTAIPVGFSHGEASFPDPYDDSAVMVRCTFLEHEGYNHSAFQVRTRLSETNKFIRHESSLKFT